MYIKINGQEYSCTRRVVGAESIKYYCEADADPVDGRTVELFRDDGFLMAEDNVAGYMRRVFENGVLTYTNQPERQPVPEEPMIEPEIEEEDEESVEDMLLDLAADHEMRLCMLELGL